MANINASPDFVSPNPDGAWRGPSTPAQREGTSMYLPHGRAPGMLTARQTLFDILVGPVPQHQRATGKSLPKIVQPRSLSDPPAHAGQSAETDRKTFGAPRNSPGAGRDH
jgi:hypothetical protein